MSEIDDSRLLQRWCQMQDETAFTALVERHLPMVTAVAARLARPDDTDDLVQATFILLARKAHDIHTPASLAGWLHGVVRRIARNARIRNARRREVALEQHGMQSSTDTAETANRLAPVLDEVLALLPTLERETLVLCYLQGQPMVAIAERMGVPVGTVGSWASRGRERLRGLLARRGICCSATVLTGALSAFSAPASASQPAVVGTVAVAVRRRPAASQVMALTRPSMSGFTLAAAATVLLIAATTLVWFSQGDAQVPEDSPASVHADPALPEVIVPVELRHHYLDEALSEINARLPLRDRVSWKIVVPKDYRHPLLA